MASRTSSIQSNPTPATPQIFTSPESLCNSSLSSASDAYRGIDLFDTTSVGDCSQINPAVLPDPYSNIMYVLGRQPLVYPDIHPRQFTSPVIESRAVMLQSSTQENLFKRPKPIYANTEYIHRDSGMLYASVNSFRHPHTTGIANVTQVTDTLNTYSVAHPAPRFATHAAHHATSKYVSPRNIVAATSGNRSQYSEVEPRSLETHEDALNSDSIKPPAGLNPDIFAFEFWQNHSKQNVTLPPSFSENKQITGCEKSSSFPTVCNVLSREENNPCKSYPNASRSPVVSVPINSMPGMRYTINSPSNAGIINPNEDSTHDSRAPWNTLVTKRAEMFEKSQNGMNVPHDSGYPRNVGHQLPRTQNGKKNEMTYDQVGGLYSLDGPKMRYSDISSKNRNFSHTEFSKGLESDIISLAQISQTKDVDCLTDQESSECTACPTINRSESFSTLVFQCLQSVSESLEKVSALLDMYHASEDQLNGITVLLSRYVSESMKAKHCLEGLWSLSSSLSPEKQSSSIPNVSLDLSVRAQAIDLSSKNARVLSSTPLSQTHSSQESRTSVYGHMRSTGTSEPNTPKANVSGSVRNPCFSPDGHPEQLLDNLKYQIIEGSKDSLLMCQTDSQSSSPSVTCDQYTKTHGDVDWCGPFLPRESVESAPIKEHKRVIPSDPLFQGLPPPLIVTNSWSLAGHMNANSLVNLAPQTTGVESSPPLPVNCSLDCCTKFTIPPKDRDNPASPSISPDGAICASFSSDSEEDLGVCLPNMASLASDDESIIAAPGDDMFRSPSLVTNTTFGAKANESDLEVIGPSSPVILRVATECAATDKSKTLMVTDIAVNSKANGADKEVRSLVALPDSVESAGTDDKSKTLMVTDTAVKAKANGADKEVRSPVALTVSAESPVTGNISEGSPDTPNIALAAPHYTVQKTLRIPPVSDSDISPQMHTNSEKLPNLNNNVSVTNSNFSPVLVSQDTSENIPSPEVCVKLDNILACESLSKVGKCISPNCSIADVLQNNLTVSPWVTDKIKGRSLSKSVTADCTETLPTDDVEASDKVIKCKVSGEKYASRDKDTCEGNRKSQHRSRRHKRLHKRRYSGRSPSTEDLQDLCNCVSGAKCTVGTKGTLKDSSRIKSKKSKRNPKCTLDSNTPNLSNVAYSAKHAKHSKHHKSVESAGPIIYDEKGTPNTKRPACSTEKIKLSNSDKQCHVDTDKNDKTLDSTMCRHKPSFRSERAHLGNEPFEKPSCHTDRHRRDKRAQYKDKENRKKSKSSHSSKKQRTLHTSHERDSHHSSRHSSCSSQERHSCNSSRDSSRESGHNSKGLDNTRIKSSNKHKSSDPNREKLIMIIKTKPQKSNQELMEVNAATPVSTEKGKDTHHDNVNTLKSPVGRSDFDRTPKSVSCDPAILGPEKDNPAKNLEDNCQAAFPLAEKAGNVQQPPTKRLRADGTSGKSGAKSPSEMPTIEPYVSKISDKNKEKGATLIPSSSGAVSSNMAKVSSHKFKKAPKGVKSTNPCEITSVASSPGKQSSGASCCPIPASSAVTDKKQASHASSKDTILQSDTCSRSVPISEHPEESHLSSPEEVIGPLHRRGFLYTQECLSIVDLIYNHEKADLFREEIKSKDVPDYYTVVKQPMWLALVAARLRQRLIPTLDDFTANMRRIFWNCKLYYKDPRCRAFRDCRKVESYFEKILKQVFPDKDFSGITGIPAPAPVHSAASLEEIADGVKEPAQIPRYLKELMG